MTPSWFGAFCLWLAAGKTYPRPPRVPARIPKLLWPAILVRVALIRSQSKPVLGPFANPGALYRAHDGGVEDVNAAVDAGLKWALLNLDATQSIEGWAFLGRRLDLFKVPWGYWFHCRTVVEVEWLLQVAIREGRPIVGINVEKELETILSPQVIADTIKRSGYAGQVCTVLLGWLPNSVDCRPIAGWPALLEIMPQDAPRLWPPYSEVHKALEHARIQGLKAPLQLMGCQPLSAGSAKRIFDETGLTVTPGLALPSWYDRAIYNAIYVTDEVEPRWPEWRW